MPERRSAQDERRTQAIAASTSRRPSRREAVRASAGTERSRNSRRGRLEDAVARSGRRRRRRPGRSTKRPAGDGADRRERRGELAPQAERRRRPISPSLRRPLAADPRASVQEPAADADARAGDSRRLRALPARRRSRAVRFVWKIDAEETLQRDLRGVRVGRGPRRPADVVGTLASPRSRTATISTPTTRSTSSCIAATPGPARRSCGRSRGPSLKVPVDLARPADLFPFARVRRLPGRLRHREDRRRCAETPRASRAVRSAGTGTPRFARTCRPKHRWNPLREATGRDRRLRRKRNLRPAAAAAGRVSPKDAARRVHLRRVGRPVRRRAAGAAGRRHGRRGRPPTRSSLSTSGGRRVPGR